jgi:radical SAM-linked protein
VKVRVRFAKQGKIRFTSHRDVARIFERALRRAQLPVRYTEGFSPRPKLAFGLALPTGYESDAEYLDIDLEDLELEGPASDGGPPASLADLHTRLDAVLPEGIRVLAVAEVDRESDAIQEAISSCTWHIDLAVDVATAAAIVEATMAAERIIVERERKGRPSTDDIRPQVVALDVVGVVPNGTRLLAELGTKPRTLRPAELLTAVAPTAPPARVRRLHQWIEHDGVRHEPIGLAEPSAPHALERAS